MPFFAERLCGKATALVQVIESELWLLNWQAQEDANLPYLGREDVVVSPSLPFYTSRLFTPVSECGAVLHSPRPFTRLPHRADSPAAGLLQALHRLTAVHAVPHKSAPHAVHCSVQSSSVRCSLLTLIAHQEPPIISLMLSTCSGSPRDAGDVKELQSSEGRY